MTSKECARSDLPRLGQGYFWQDLAVGQRMRTFRRTVTETDLVNFIGVTGRPLSSGTRSKRSLK